MSFRILKALLLIAPVALAAVAVPAEAHTPLVGSNPAEGAVLDTVPAQIELTFAEPVTLPAEPPVEIIGPSGATATLGTATTDGPVVRVPVTSVSGPAGEYTISWKAVSSDGDPVAGNIVFTLSTAAAPSTTTSAPPATLAAPAAESSDEDDDGFPAWAWIVSAAAAGFIVAGVIVIVQRRRAT